MIDQAPDGWHDPLPVRLTVSLAEAEKMERISFWRGSFLGASVMAWVILILKWLT
jgi:hypothetical protein